MRICRSFWMAFQVGKARKKYKVPYPTFYAVESENKEAKLFNCVQRGHQNSLELMSMFFMLMILGGISHPRICAAVGSSYVISCYFYFKGYATGNHENRLTFGMRGYSGACISQFTCPIIMGMLHNFPLNFLWLETTLVVVAFRKYGLLAIMGFTFCIISFGMQQLRSHLHMDTLF